ncbi:hypothetical protein RND81_06G073900 [Saponaria officinalis]|uniref:Uncharacterized protein n=1 Tax=Saponaria officinalis TaxID=3572 RepID=A0AAW1K918_SAPOF
MDLQCQPSNSPDLNVNDLGFFRVIQTLQHEKAPTTVCQLVDVVLKAFYETSDHVLIYVWLSLMYCMNEILIDKGNNKYKLPQVGKVRLSRLGLLPTHVSPNKEVVIERMQEYNAASEVANTSIEENQASEAHIVDFEVQNAIIDQNESIEEENAPCEQINVLG